MVRGAILDVGGTLVDSNDAHARAWEEAFREAGLPVPFEGIRPLIGMGGDKLVPRLTGWSADDPRVEDLGRRRGEIFRERHLPRVRAFAGARGLVVALRAAGLKLAVASSADGKELEPLLERAGAAALIEHKTSSDDAPSSKPDPDVVHAALGRLGLPASEVAMIGDTPYDVEAAGRAGIVAIAFRCGGWDDASLRGAREIYDSAADLLERLPESILLRGHPAVV
ncbi:MAG: hydrolase [Acidobacteria bacterium]|nr:MAG: hydrolase [Acidobacteriota bacterium]PYQ25689.1 MAG: hydrolase [Acidobacteriota bacterium]